MQTCRKSDLLVCTLLFGRGNVECWGIFWIAVGYFGMLLDNEIHTGVALVNGNIVGSTWVSQDRQQLSSRVHCYPQTRRL